MFNSYIFPVLNFIFSFIKSSERVTELTNIQSNSLISESASHLQNNIGQNRNFYRRKKKTKRKRLMAEFDSNYTDEDIGVNSKILDIISTINDIQKEKKGSDDTKHLLIKLQELIIGTFDDVEKIMFDENSNTIICQDFEFSIEYQKNKYIKIKKNCMRFYKIIFECDARICENNLKEEINQSIIRTLVKRFNHYTNKMVTVFEKLQACYTEYLKIKKSIKITETFKNLQIY